MKPAARTITNRPTILTNKFIGGYRIVSEFKRTTAGRVLLGIYFKNLWFKRCILKEMCFNHKSIAENRNRYERLLWQFQLHQRLYAELPVPRPLEIAEAEGCAYLILDFIKGDNLQMAVDKLYGKQSFKELSSSAKRRLLDWLTEAVRIVNSLHRLLCPPRHHRVKLYCLKTR